jgi:diguanylate cyclase (GGDEF)-like protein
MQSVGLDGGGAPADAAGALQPMLAGQRMGSLDEVVLGVLGWTRSATYRGIVTALTAAALRYGDYDRVFFARWLPETGMVNLRSKADGSSRRVVQRCCATTAAEAQALQTALREDRPVHLEAPLRAGTGLLAVLSTDDLIAMPVNGSFQQPSFLLLDRALTLAPVDLYRDGPMAITLGKMGSLLHENLLLRRRRQRAQKFALTDPLTRLFNRRMGLVALEQELARSERAPRPLTVLMCDLDHFKQLNDTLGHLQGDHALRATAEVLRQTLRKSDTVCRYGGEEFLIVLPDTTAAEATVLATRLFTTVHRTGEDLGLPVTISIGLTTHRPGDTVETILHRADHALYASKGYGRNRFSADVDGDAETWPARATP